MQLASRQRELILIRSGVHLLLYCMRPYICAARVQEEETDMQNFTKQGGRSPVWPPLGSAPAYDLTTDKVEREREHIVSGPTCQHPRMTLREGGSKNKARGGRLLPCLDPLVLGLILVRGLKTLASSYLDSGNKTNLRSLNEWYKRPYYPYRSKCGWRW